MDTDCGYYPSGCRAALVVIPVRLRIRAAAKTVVLARPFLTYTGVARLRIYTQAAREDESVLADRILPEHVAASGPAEGAHVGGQRLKDDEARGQGRVHGL